MVTFMLDSASDIHVIQLREAIKYFSEKSNSNLKVLGVSGNVTRADLRGHLVIVVEDDGGNKHNIDLEIAHGMEQVPVNLLSVSAVVALSIWKKITVICTYIKMVRKLISVAKMACLRLMPFPGLLKATVLPVNVHVLSTVRLLQPLLI